jgi:hypothetical protein
MDLGKRGSGRIPRLNDHFHPWRCQQSLFAIDQVVFIYTGHFLKFLH